MDIFLKHYQVKYGNFNDIQTIKLVIVEIW